MKKLCTLIFTVFIVCALAFPLIAWEWPWEICKTKYPIVYVHGFGAGFDSPDTYLQDALNSNIPAKLRTKGFNKDFIIAQFQACGLIDEFAQAVKEEIETNIPQGGKFHIVAHSVGGLISRYIISQGLLDGDRTVLSLSTMASPHKGILLAQTGKDILEFVFPDDISGDGWLKFEDYLLGMFGSLFVKGLDEIGPENSCYPLKNNPDYMDSIINEYSYDNIRGYFNPENRNVPGVFYQTFAGVVDYCGISCMNRCAFTTTESLDFLASIAYPFPNQYNIDPGNDSQIMADNTVLDGIVLDVPGLDQGDCVNHEPLDGGPFYAGVYHRSFTGKVRSYSSSTGECTVPADTPGFDTEDFWVDLVAGLKDKEQEKGW